MLNLGGLLLGFAILAQHFKDSGLPDRIPHFLPPGILGELMLLLYIMVLSSFLDNIAAPMLGGTIDYIVYKGKIHIAYLAAIIVASNAGGTGSVIGDTTTTLIWIDGISPAVLFPAYIGSVVSFLVFGFAGSYVQMKYVKSFESNGEIIKEKPSDKSVLDHSKLIISVLIILGAILANYFIGFPAAGIWIAILAGAFFVRTPWSAMQKSFKGTIFLLAPVTSASLMPVKELPQAS